MSDSTPGVSLPASLEDARIPGLPQSFYYIPNFITAEEEALILSKISSAPASKWVNLSRRRLQVYPAQLTPRNVLVLPPATPSSSAATTSTLPDWLAQPILPRFAQLDVFAGTPHGAANHVLVNEYRPGQGIMAHEDGEAYAPVTATVSLGAVGVLELYEKPDGGAQDLPEGSRGADEGGEERRPRWRVLQEERSLLVTRGDAYKSLLHGIRESSVDEGLDAQGIVNWALLGDKARFAGGRCERGTRVSLTCRDVLKVSRLGERLLGRR